MFLLPVNVIKTFENYISSCIFKTFAGTVIFRNLAGVIGWCDGLGKLPVPGRPTSWITVGQAGPRSAIGRAPDS